jgi:hypothetical protein
LGISQNESPRLADLKSLIAVLALIVAGCGGAREPEKNLQPVYNKKTGRLEILKYDSDGDGKFETISYMDGARIIRIEIDKDEDGKVDRWEYYGPGQKLEKVGVSRANDGKEDAWTLFDATGAISHIEVATNRDGKPNRFEYYRKNVLVRAEEDTDGDGRIDKWENYDGPRLASVAFDLQHRGTPDRRLVYTTDGSAHLEIDKIGDGHFAALAETQPETKGAHLAASRGSVH